MILLNNTGRPLVAAGKPFLTSMYVPPVVPPTPGASLPTASIAGHWDVSTLTAATAYTIPDSSTAAKTATVSVSSGTPKVAQRVAGMMPGLYAEGSASNYTVRTPVIPGYNVNAASIPVGTGGKLAVWLVWSRPNLSQPANTVFSNAPVNLLSVDGTVVLQLGAVGTGADVMTLFPASTAAQAGSFTLRHTRAVLVQFDGGAVTVTLDDGSVLFNSATSAITLGATAALMFVQNAGLIFHDAGAYSKALDSTEKTSWLGYIARWNLGARYAAHALVMGQSNVGIYMNNAATVTAKALSYVSGCLTSSLIMGGYNTPGATVFSGTALYDATGNLVLNSAGGGDPSTWPLGTNGNTLMSAIDAMAADDRDNIASLFWFWSETLSSTLTYAKKAEAKAAHMRAWSLIRAKLGRTAAQLPVMLIDPLPFTTTQGAQTMREVFADLVADSTQNAAMMLASTQDAIGQGDTWAPSTGLESGPGNNSHRDDSDMIAFSRRLVVPLARASIAGLAARGRIEPSTINAALPMTGGPRVTAAVLEQAGTVLVTLAHDGGNDLVVPLRAAAGAGWCIMDGISSSVASTPGAAGNRIDATACVRVSATQLRLTFASGPVYPTRAKLHYTYGTGLDGSNYAVIGRGNSVTDNLKDIALPAGWDIKSYLGAAAQPNNPLQTTPYGIALT